MNLIKDRRVLTLGGAGLALVAGLGLAWAFLARTPPQAAPPPASQGGLVVQSGRDDDLKLDPNRPLRCFVGGQFVGDLPLSVCAQRNGVATGALDVGLDQSGALAASNGAAGAQITPRPPQTPFPAPPEQPPQSQPLAETAPSPDASNAVASAQTPALAQASGAACWRYGAGGWRQLPTPLSLNACAQAVFGGRCPPQGEAFYGRWGDQALRLADGQVGISADNQDFRSLIDPWPACPANPG